MARTEFGYTRTSSASTNDILNCVFIPGYLIPNDLPRMAGKKPIMEWAMENLLASPGATVVMDGEIVKIPTLVPARNAKGSCRFFCDDMSCKIHKNAPFGCAFFDAQMTAESANEISIDGLMSILEAWKSNGIYAQVWTALHEAGKNSPSPEENRKLLKMFAIGEAP